MSWFSVRLARTLQLASVLTLLPVGALAESVSSQTPDAARRAQPIVKAKDFGITVGDIEDYIAQQAPAVRERYRDEAERKSLVENMLRLALMSREAARRGYGKAIAVRHTVKDGAIQALIRSEIDEKITPEDISSADIEAHYKAHTEDFHRPAERRASAIKLATRGEAEKLLPEVLAADLRRFGELAKERSIDAETKLRGGDLGYFVLAPSDAGPRLSSVDTAIRGAIFGLKTIGDTAPEPIATEGSFVIVRLTGERPERHADLAAASSSIRNRLWRDQRAQAVAALIERVRAREKPEVHTDYVDLVKFDDMDQAPQGFNPEPAPPATPVSPTPKP
jgi:peptidyl-prolyl cis-trans isomerase C